MDDTGSHDTGFILFSQDFRGRPPGSTASPPRRERTFFRTRAAAAAALTVLRIETGHDSLVVACICPAPASRAKHKPRRKVKRRLAVSQPGLFP